MTIEFLLRHHLASGDPRPLLIARRSLDSMADGGLRDQLGGGFHRYSTDAHWLVPHFEQMLYDNAQLARVYLHGALTGDPDLLAVAVGRSTTCDGNSPPMTARSPPARTPTPTASRPHVHLACPGSGCSATQPFAAAYGVTEGATGRVTCNRGTRTMRICRVVRTLGGGVAARQPRPGALCPTRRPATASP
jgi:hypothetical protein